MKLYFFIIFFLIQKEVLDLNYQKEVLQINIYTNGLTEISQELTDQKIRINTKTKIK